MFLYNWLASIFVLFKLPPINLENALPNIVFIEDNAFISFLYANTLARTVANVPTPSGSLAKADIPALNALKRAFAITLPSLTNMPIQSICPRKSPIDFPTSHQFTVESAVSIVSSIPFAPSLIVSPNSCHPVNPVLASTFPISSRNPLIASPIFLPSCL